MNERWMGPASGKRRREPVHFQHGRSLTLAGQRNLQRPAIDGYIDLNAMASSPKAGEQLTEHEAAIYDRQLRVWGVETQKRRVEGCQRLRACLQGRWLQLCKPPPALQCRRPHRRRHSTPSCPQAQPGASAHSRLQRPGSRGAQHAVAATRCIYQQSIALSFAALHHSAPLLQPPPPLPFLLPPGGQEHSAGRRGISGTGGRHTLLAAPALQLPGPR